MFENAVQQLLDGFLWINGENGDWMGLRSNANWPELQENHSNLIWSQFLPAGSIIGTELSLDVLERG